MLFFLKLIISISCWVFAQEPAPADLSVEDAAPDATAQKAEKKAAGPPSMFEEEEGMLVKKLTTPFEYDRQAKRDPFRLPELTNIDVQLGGYFGPFLELQEVPLDTIKVRALILDPVSPKAVVAFKGDEEKMVSRKVKIGDFIGESFGVVQAIREGQIIVVQTFVEGDQKLTTTKTLNIRK